MKKSPQSTVNIKLNMNIRMASDPIPIPNSDYKLPKIVCDQDKTVKVGRYQALQVETNLYRENYYGKLYKHYSNKIDVEITFSAGLRQENKEIREDVDEDIFRLEI
ncbi:MAG: hypothetical protein ABI597_05395 [Gammaproteobacteria bacterium]